MMIDNGRLDEDAFPGFFQIDDAPIMHGFAVVSGDLPFDAFFQFTNKRAVAHGTCLANRDANTPILLQKYESGALPYTATAGLRKASQVTASGCTWAS